MNVRNRLVARRHKERLEQMSQRGEAPCMVAFYHRVADTHPNGWSINRGEFQRQLDYFQQRFEPVSLSEVQRRVSESFSAKPTITITFDDGYRDNVDFALPLLIERNMPCTYFVSTAHVLDQKPFGHDLGEGMALPINTVKQIREWSDAGIEMGCHTRNHVDFSKVHDPAERHREIVDAKDELEQITGKKVRHFAFPFGTAKQLTPEAIETVQQAGFEGFCSAFGGYNLVGRDAFHIRRFHGDPQFSRLVNWCSFDERKLALEPELSFQHSDADVSQSNHPGQTTV